MSMPGTTLIVAHRGVVAEGAHENTLAAFETAIRLGSDLIECDLRRTLDGQYVIHHDAAVGTKVISNHPWPAIQGEGRVLGYEIPTLGDLLGLTSGRIGLDLELKESGYERDVITRVLQRAPADAFVITSFHPESIKVITADFPNLRCGLLLSNMPPDCRERQRGNGASRLFAKARDELKAHFLAPHWRLLDQQFLQKAVETGLPLWVWTVDDRNILEMCFGHPAIAAVITDHVELALSLRYPRPPE
ncbi:MAG: glycerophosphodiester phosphodiesterase [Verrucomicrobia bacterium]|nr:glycerophosphodiester phosphodiesterase [Verrucomicrobiota bacterium]